MIITDSGRCLQNDFSFERILRQEGRVCSGLEVGIQFKGSLEAVNYLVTEVIEFLLVYQTTKFHLIPDDARFSQAVCQQIRHLLGIWSCSGLFTEG